MLDPETARMLARYNAWANRLILESVAALPEGEASKDRPTLFRTILHTLNHLHVTDRIWRAHLEGKPHGFRSLREVPHPQLRDLQEAQRELDDWYLAWAAAARAETLGEEVEFQFIDGKPGVLTRGEIFLHVVNHTTYHRGWVADLFFQIPAIPPTTDLPVFAREERRLREAR